MGNAVRGVERFAELARSLRASANLLDAEAEVDPACWFSGWTPEPTTAPAPWSWGDDEDEDEAITVEPRGSASGFFPLDTDANALRMVWRGTESW